MIRAFQWDLAGQVERLNALNRRLPMYADWGYEELYLHLEDAVHYPSLPGIGRDDAYRHEQISALVDAAGRVGICVVPIVNLLGHTQYLIKHPDYRDLNELRDPDGHPLKIGQICPLHPRTPEVADALIRDTAPWCTAGKLHVGLDESFHVGKCPRCRAEVGRVGVGGHFAAHAKRLHKICGRHGLRMAMWADMLALVPEAIGQLPADIAVYDWYYYPFQRKPRVELFNFAEVDLATPLTARGIEYFGCPMNGAFRHEPMPVFGERLANIRSWWKRCREVDASGFLVTSWEPYRLALDTTTLVDAAAAGLWLEPEVQDDVGMLAGGLRRLHGIKDGRALARRLLTTDHHPFAGYPRWQVNERWDVFAGTDGLKRAEAEQRFFRRLSRTSTAWPDSLRASVQFRSYLADRDVFVRKAANDVLKWRRILRKGDRANVTYYVTIAGGVAAGFARAIRQGRAAAREMWIGSRDRRSRGQNDLMLAADAGRLREWRAWLRHVLRNPDAILDGTPVCGAWQLLFWVHNFAPALQRIVVEREGPGGTWLELLGCHLIEFRAHAAVPTAKAKFEFSVPVNAPGTRLRIAVRGIGQVAISHIQLTDGVETHRRRDWTLRKTIGSRAPCSGLPGIDWNLNTGAVDVRTG